MISTFFLITSTIFLTVGQTIFWNKRPFDRAQKISFAFLKGTHYFKLLKMKWWTLWNMKAFHKKVITYLCIQVPNLNLNSYLDGILNCAFDCLFFVKGDWKLYVHTLNSAGMDTKGQLILKCPFSVFKSPKNQRNFFQDFCPSL